MIRRHSIVILVAAASATAAGAPKSTDVPKDPVYLQSGVGTV